MAVWLSLAGRFTVTMFVGLYMHEMNEGIEVSFATLQRLAERRINLSFDIYSLGKRVTAIR
jgi:hypothetical protein